jgi:hypothetical protein
VIRAAAVDGTERCFGRLRLSCRVRGRCGCVVTVHRRLGRRTGRSGLEPPPHAVHAVRRSETRHRQRPEGRHQHDQQQNSRSPTPHTDGGDHTSASAYRQSLSIRGSVLVSLYSPQSHGERPEPSKTQSGKGLLSSWVSLCLCASVVKRPIRTLLTAGWVARPSAWKSLTRVPRPSSAWAGFSSTNPTVMRARDRAVRAAEAPGWISPPSSAQAVTRKASGERPKLRTRVNKMSQSRSGKGESRRTLANRFLRIETYV